MSPLGLWFHFPALHSADPTITVVQTETSHFHLLYQNICLYLGLEQKMEIKSSGAESIFIKKQISREDAACGMFGLN